MKKSETDHADSAPAANPASKVDVESKGNPFVPSKIPVDVAANLEALQMALRDLSENVWLIDREQWLQIQNAEDYERRISLCESLLGIDSRPLRRHYNENTKEDDDLPF
jgi:hypothetical protein